MIQLKKKGSKGFLGRLVSLFAAQANVKGLRRGSVSEPPWPATGPNEVQREKLPHGRWPASKEEALHKNKIFF